MAYQKNTWVLFEEGIPAHEQPDAFITKQKLDHIETGIRSAVTDFKLGTISKGTDVQCEIISDENDPSVKRINLVIPKEVSWLFSQVELMDNGVAPTGATLNDMVLDNKGNIFTISENINGVYILHKRLNIMGETGKEGPMGPEGKAGADGKEGKSAYQLWIEQGNTGSVEQFFTFLKGPSGDSTYDLWKRLGYEGTPQDFLDSLKGDSIASNKLNTLDEVLANEKEGMFVDALMIKEMYLKLQEQINNLGGE